jgi:hypothetical protein
MTVMLMVWSETRRNEIILDGSGMIVKELLMKTSERSGIEIIMS